MTTGTFTQAEIKGIVTCIPENYRTLDEDLHILYGGDLAKLERIKKSIGLNKRHIVEGEMTSADLCEAAAKALLKSHQINKDSIDALICVTQTPDYFQPCNAAYLHGQLDLTNSCAAFDVNQGCSGYIYGLWLASMMIESNSCDRVLLLAGDTLSKVVNKEDSNIAPLFGDAGTATILERSGNIDSYFSLHTDGKKFDTIIQPKGAFRLPSKEQINDGRIFDTTNIRELSDLYMDGAAVFSFSIGTEPKAIEDLLSYSNKSKEDIDYIFFHQANKYIISNIARRLKIPLKKAPSETTGKFGNQSSASIPCTICDVLGPSMEELELDIILSGFGVGLSWASCLTSLKQLKYLDIISIK